VSWLLVLAMTAAGAWALALRRVRAEWRAIPTLHAGASMAGLDEMLAVVPVRNEARHVEGCLAALRAMRWPNLRVCVVDDGSTDDTLERVRGVAREDDRVEVTAAPPLPAGACGKPHALWAAVRDERSARWLLFVDADVRVHPDLAAALAGAAEHHAAGLASVLPRLDAHGFWARLVQPSVGALVLAQHRPSRVNDPARPADAFANGQVLLVDRAQYQAAGGHGAVVGEVLEDTALARHLKARGVRLLLAAAPALAATDMYRGLGEIVAGWRKNLLLLAGRRPARLVAMAATGVALSWVPLVAGVAGIAGWPSPTAMGLVLCYALVLAAQAGVRGAAGAWPHYAVLAPVGSLIVAFIAAASIIGHRAGGTGVTWKGRRYPPAPGARG
jgi:hypothetical protein